MAGVTQFCNDFACNSIALHAFSLFPVFELPQIRHVAGMQMVFEELAMSAVTAKRGRPTGSGIDDRIWLRELGRLIRIKPGTRPTTAIKALGISDPSTIRRLREKHKRHAPSRGA